MTNSEWILANLDRDGYFKLVSAMCPPNHNYGSPCPDILNDNEGCGECWDMWFNEEYKGYEPEN